MFGYRNQRYFLLLLIVTLGIANACKEKNTDANQDRSHLSVSEDGHYLCREGRPYFWLGDTGWFLFTQSPDDVEKYVQDRASRGFNTLQVMVTNKRFDAMEFRKDYSGETPFLNLDPVELNESYFVHMDLIVRTAEKYNMVIALFPTWGWALDQMFSTGKLENAYQFGYLLGNRIKNTKM